MDKAACPSMPSVYSGSILSKEFSILLYLLFTVVDCGQLPSPANGQVSLSGTLFGSTASYSCGVGFNLVGNTIRTCLADGQWSGIAPTCQCELLQ